MAETAFFAASALKATNEFGQAINESKAIKAQAKYDSVMAGINSQKYEQHAKEVERLSTLEENKMRTNAIKFAGTQKAVASAQGIDPTTGTASELIQDTIVGTELDAITARNNAWREAYGYRSAADELRRKADFNRSQAKRKARMTVATGGINFASSIGVSGYQAKTFAKPKGN